MQVKGRFQAVFSRVSVNAGQKKIIGTTLRKWIATITIRSEWTATTPDQCTESTLSGLAMPRVKIHSRMFFSR